MSLDARFIAQVDMHNMLLWPLTLPATSCDLHTSVEAGGAGEVLNQDAMVTLLDVTVDVLLTEWLEYSLDAVNAPQHSLGKHRFIGS